jgi:hypothetical protein
LFNAWIVSACIVDSHRTDFTIRWKETHLTQL